MPKGSAVRAPCTQGGIDDVHKDIWQLVRTLAMGMQVKVCKTPLSMFSLLTELLDHARLRVSILYISEEQTA